MVVTVASACSAPAVPLPSGDLTQPRSGSRLRARLVQSGDTRALLEFVDTALGVDCTFSTVAGAVICAPARWGQLMFTDPGCDDAYMDGPSDALVSTDRGVFRVGTQPVVPERTWFYFRGDCVEGPRRDGWAIREAMPIEAFVAGAWREADPPEARLTRVGYLGADGAWAPGGLWDRALANSCTASLEGGETRCAPPAGSLTLDRACRDPRVVAVGEVGAVVMIRERPEGSCTGQAQLRRLEGYDSEGHFGALHQGRCVPGLVGTDGASVFTTSPPMSVEQLAPVTRTASGSGDVRVTGAATLDGRFAPRAHRRVWTHLPDLETRAGEPCALAWLAGELRCVAASFVTGDVGAPFADEACTRPLAYAGDGQRVAAVYGDRRDGFVEVNELRALGDVVTGPSRLLKK